MSTLHETYMKFLPRLCSTDYCSLCNTVSRSIAVGSISGLLFRLQSTSMHASPYLTNMLDLDFKDIYDNRNILYFDIKLQCSTKEIDIK